MEDEFNPQLVVSHEWAQSKAVRQAKLDEMRKEARTAYLATLNEQKRYYDRIYGEFYERFVVNGESMPEEWHGKSDVVFKGCYFASPSWIKSRKSK